MVFAVEPPIMNAFVTKDSKEPIAQIECVFPDAEPIKFVIPVPSLENPHVDADPDMADLAVPINSVPTVVLEKASVSEEFANAM